MRAEVVAVGSELLMGEGVDTNSAWISARLAEIGVDVHRHTTVGDNLERLTAVLREAAERADAVVVTGGLGPTQDDLTRFAVARVAGVELERREDLAQWLRDYFARAGREMPERNLVQADIPAGARVLEAAGTAAGFVVELPGSVVYCVPGPPSEMKILMERDVLPDLARRGGLAVTLSRTVHTAGIGEAAVAEACAGLVERLDREGGVTLAFYASGGETRVQLRAKASTRQEAEALLAPVVEEVVALLGPGFAGLDGEGVEHAIARLLREAGLTLGLAESVTGGGVGARLVRVAGASDWLRGGLVVYATDAKRDLAGVDAGLLERHGPVSEPIAAALARAAAERLGADVGLAVVGVAGPATQGDQPVGTVCLGFAFPAMGVERTRTLRTPARERGEALEFAASAALD
ncbi:MAG TPA: CinA family nicotinamide mononucleotide deamidase-related protein, partial [Egibacteraceae bacterium]|nr:CinA family nicotinamide mononucleotide deamidase-related protein [Egibacteraceae bacterium]